MDLILDFSEINSEDNFHKILKENLNFPSYYGENLDALWDILTVVKLNLSLKNFYLSKLEIKEVLLDFFQELSNFNENFTFNLV